MTRRNIRHEKSTNVLPTILVITVNNESLLTMLSLLLSHINKII